MKQLLEHLQNPDLMSIKGMTTELGWKTERTTLKNLSECEDWLRNNPNNSIRLILDNEQETIDFKL